MADENRDSKKFSVQPLLPSGTAACWREAAYRIKGVIGLGDLYFQIAARAAFNEYDFISPKLKKVYRVKPGQFYASQREIGRLIGRDYVKTKELIAALVDRKLINFDIFSDCICFEVVSNPATLLWEHVGSHLHGSCKQPPTRHVGDDLHVCRQPPTRHVGGHGHLRKRGKKKEEKGGGKENGNPPPSKIKISSFENEIGNGEEPPEVGLVLSNEENVLLGLWKLRVSKIDKNTTLDNEREKNAIKEMMEIYSLDMHYAVLTFLNTPTTPDGMKLSKEFVKPSFYKRPFFGGKNLLLSTVDEMNKKKEEEKPKPYAVPSVDSATLEERIKLFTLKEEERKRADVG